MKYRYTSIEIDNDLTTKIKLCSKLFRIMMELNDSEFESVQSGTIKKSVHTITLMENFKILGI